MTPRQLAIRAVIARHSRAFAWGTDDCVSFARDVLETLTGRRLQLPVWHDKASADEVIASHGGLREAVCAWLGAPAEDNPADGDVVVLQSDDRQLCGVWASGRPLVRAARGVVPMPHLPVIAHWRAA